jgi:hypothetical protein
LTCRKIVCYDSPRTDLETGSDNPVMPSFQFRTVPAFETACFAVRRRGRHAAVGFLLSQAPVRTGMLR